MKKICFLLIVIGMSSAFALDFSPETLDLFFYSLKIDEDQISESFCDTIESQWTVKLGKKCDASAGSIAYDAPTDESVYIEMRKEDSLLVIHLYRENQTCENPFRFSAGVSGTSGKLQFSEVLRLELLRLQSFGILKMQRDSLENFLQEKIELMKAAGKCDDIDRVYFSEDSGAEWVLGPGCCSLVDSTAAIVRMPQISSGVRMQKVSPGKIRLSGVSLGTAIEVFDLNGRLLLRKAFDGGLLEIPNVPVVVEILGKKLWIK